MKVALLGLSHPHSGILLTTLQNLPEITRIVLWDPHPATVARPDLPPAMKASAPTTDLDGVLGQPDLVFAIVCARHDEEAALASRVIAAGKHLVAEKPVGLTSGEIAGVQAAARRAGVIASVLYTRRFHPSVVRARALAESGAIGSLLTAECRFLTTQVKFRGPKTWLFKRQHAGGGILLWLGCHCLDLLHHISGDEITEVGAMLATRSGESIDVEDCCALALKFRSGAIGTFHAGYTLAYSGSGYVNASGYDSYLAFNGQLGRIVWPDLEPRLTIESPPGPDLAAQRVESYELPASTSYGGAAGEVFLRRFIAATQGKGTPPTTLEDALRTARVIEAAADSARSGRIWKVAARDSSRLFK